jgi:HlyD family secretion protein
VDIARTAPPRVRGPALSAALAALAVVGVVAVLWRSTPAAAPAVDRASVWTDRVRRGDLLRQVPVQGALVPEHVQWLSAVSAARVARIALRPGAQVEPDTVVVVLENAELELAALEAERQAASAESATIQLDVRTDADHRLEESTIAGLRADLHDAERHARAADLLAPQGLMSELDHGGAQDKALGLSGRLEVEEGREHVLAAGRARQLDAQRAEVERLRDIARFRRKQLAALEVRAGIRGVVQDVPLENGQWVAIGTVLAKVAEPERLKADVRVAEANARDLHRGLAVRFEAPSGDFRGHVERVDPAVVGGSVRLEVALDDPSMRGARVDQTVTGFVEIEKLADVLFVARPAGVQDAATAGVFRLDGDRVHAARVAARFGRGTAREIEVVGGLSEGDEVVVSDTSSWDTPDRVRIR